MKSILEVVINTAEASVYTTEAAPYSKPSEIEPSKARKIVYDINDVYAAKVKEEQFKLAFVDVKGNGSVYSKVQIDVSSVIGRAPTTSHKERELNDKVTFVEYVQSNGFDHLLLNPSGKQLTEVTPLQICNIIDKINRMTLLSPRELDGLKNASRDYACKVADLLGFNVYVNPNSNLKLNDRTEIIVSAPKMVKFISILSNFILTELLDINKIQSRIITNEISSGDHICDVMVKRSLKRSGINYKKITENEFTARIGNFGFSIDEKQKQKIMHKLY